MTDNNKTIFNGTSLRRSQTLSFFSFFFYSTSTMKRIFFSLSTTYLSIHPPFPSLPPHSALRVNTVRGRKKIHQWKATQVSASESNLLLCLKEICTPCFGHCVEGDSCIYLSIYNLPPSLPPTNQPTKQPCQRALLPHSTNAAPCCCCVLLCCWCCVEVTIFPRLFLS